MSNVLRDLVRKNEVAGGKLAKELGIPQARIYRALKRGNDIPDRTDWRDIQAIASFFGKKAVVVMVDKDDTPS